MQGVNTPARYKLIKSKIMKKTSKIKVVASSDAIDFENKVNKIIEAGFKLSSSSCGFVNSERYDFCDAYHAILIKTEDTSNVF